MIERGNNLDILNLDLMAQLEEEGGLEQEQEQRTSIPPIRMHVLGDVFCDIVCSGLAHLPHMDQVDTMLLHTHTHTHTHIYTLTHTHIYIFTHTHAHTHSHTHTYTHTHIHTYTHTHTGRTGADTAIARGKRAQYRLPRCSARGRPR
jgi:hypothetical protein